jgi:hypothetical protein
MSLFRCLGRTKVSIQVRGKCSCFVTKPVFTVSSRWHLAQLPSWRTTLCRLSATPYSIYSQLPSILEAVPPSATWGRAMPWWQVPTHHGFHMLYDWKNPANLLTKSARVSVRLLSFLGFALSMNVFWHTAYWGHTSSVTKALVKSKYVYIPSYFPEVGLILSALPGEGSSSASHHPTETFPLCRVTNEKQQILTVNSIIMYAVRTFWRLRVYCYLPDTRGYVRKEFW